MRWGGDGEGVIAGEELEAGEAGFVAEGGGRL